MATVGEQFVRANGFDDFFPAYSQEFAEAETARFMEWVEKEYRGEYVGSANNVKTFAAFFEVNDIPYTLHNMKVAFVYLRSEKLLEKEAVETDPQPEPQTKYSPPIVLRVQKDAADVESEQQEVARLRELDAAPRSRKRISVGDALRREYQQSLQQNKNDGKKVHMTEGEARAAVAEKFPELAVGSVPFNEWVARLRFNQYSND